ncbi:murein DD-endopeptidase MepM/ murein hydrolase activator NlpD [Sporomusaceae bacterium BoRhaA]|uniref:M23 family metallopeptidase n=1 Tax=Pelorhabdus rhamnosifermentans TaxID=2772457 RepID=UPI001C0622EE|nr:M23 family metallopeptidase [Pelorhabdus rhamnosifermentans]MBU2698941.1 murein DD-endopeptidase MepM/ murein hydrolase activator NlpD [Pelorhabdus rhamnosifermentans]
MPSQSVLFRKILAISICFLLALFLLGGAVLPAFIAKTSQQPVIPSTDTISESLSDQPDTASTQAATSILQNSDPEPSRAIVAVVEDKPWLHEKPRLPLAGKLRLAYGWEIHPVFGDWRFHTGIDFDAMPSEAVTAVMSGIVTSSCEEKHTGLTVTIESGPRQFIYGSLVRTPLKVGAKVAQGEVIGYTGQCTDEPYDHLHLGLKVGEDYEDPQKLF